MPRVPGTHVDDPRRLGRRLREARLRAGLSQRDLAFPGCTNAYISRIESGNRIPSLQVIHEFARRLEVSPQYLATGVEDEDRDQQLLDAEVALRLGELDEAGRLYRARLAENEHDPVALGGLGQVALRAGDLRTAVGLLEQAVELRGDRLLGDPMSVESLARAYALTGALDAAIALLERALAEAEQADAIVETLRMQVLLANALIDAAQLPRAERILADAIRVATDLRDPLATAKVFWSQSRLHSVHKDPELGARYARRAIEILERTENSAYVALAYQLLAYAEVEAGNADAALAQVEKGRELFGRDLTPRDDAKFALEECRALLALGRVGPAAGKAAQALGKLDALDPQDRGRGFMLLGEVFRASGDRERALELLELAVATLEEQGKPYVVDAATRLSELLEEQGRPEEALAVLRRALGSGSRTADVPAA
jgi:tetratricopeptide (TPR) repeat protein